VPDHLGDHVVHALFDRLRESKGSRPGALVLISRLELREVLSGLSRIECWHGDDFATPDEALQNSNTMLSD